ncbi:MAG: hypothetical protein H6940_11270, partial [Burkholderiales bacterium]|nr:hypothetical protein [Burkholderiales bacterium]
ANGVQVGSSTQAPFTVNWDTTQTSNGLGYLQAHAFDAAGNTTVSFSRNILVNNLSP